MKAQICIDGGQVPQSSMPGFVHNLRLNNCKNLKQNHHHYDKFNCKCSLQVHSTLAEGGREASKIWSNRSETLVNRDVNSNCNFVIYCVSLEKLLSLILILFFAKIKCQHSPHAVVLKTETVFN